MATQIIFAPLELIPERYSCEWRDMFMSELNHFMLSAEDAKLTVAGDATIRSVGEGEFLDPIVTNKYKLAQADEIIEALKQNRDGDNIVLCMDGWYPPITMLAYIRDTLDIRCKFIGIFHAGTYDTHDFLFRKGLASWGRSLERSMLAIYDKIVVATNYHKRLLLDTFGTYWYDKILVRPFPIADLSQYQSGIPWEERDNIIVFPHRLAPEKNFDDFNALIQDLHLRMWNTPQWGTVEVAFTKNIPNLTKDKYYNLLAHAKIVVSTAYQETYGIAMLEATQLGCVPLVPNRLSYPELYNPWCVYNSQAELLDKTHSLLTDKTWQKPPAKKLARTCELSTVPWLSSLLKSVWRSHVTAHF